MAERAERERTEPGTRWSRCGRGIEADPIWPGRRARRRALEAALAAVEARRDALGAELEAGAAAGE